MQTTLNLRYFLGKLGGHPAAALSQVGDQVLQCVVNFPPDHLPRVDVLVISPRPCPVECLGSCCQTMPSLPHGHMETHDENLLGISALCNSLFKVGGSGQVRFQPVGVPGNFEGPARGHADDVVYLPVIFSVFRHAGVGSKVADSGHQGLGWFVKTCKLFLGILFSKS